MSRCKVTCIVEDPEVRNAIFAEGDLRAILFATEHDDSPAALRRFSFAGGKSTYSFGLLQFDVDARPAARQFLRETGFTEDDIKRLRRPGGLSESELRELDAKLLAVPEAKLNEFTDSQLRENIRRIDALIEHLEKSNPSIAAAVSHSRELQLALADYDNQFHLDGIGSRPQPNTMLAYLEGQPVRRNGQTLQLGHGLVRQDLQNYIDGTAYARAHPGSVRSREERLVGALSKLGVLGEATWVADAQPIAPTLHFGATGADVVALQERLARLGYTDAKGRPVAADGQFGPLTRAAVEAFQRDRGLAADGQVGRLTRSALDAALEERQIADAEAQRRTGTFDPALRSAAPAPAFLAPDHPQRALYETLHSIFPQGTSEARLCQALAACHAVGIDRPQKLASVVATDDAIHFGSREPGSLTGHMDISRSAPAVEQSLQQVYAYDLQQVQVRSHAQPVPVTDLQ